MRPRLLILAWVAASGLASLVLVRVLGVERGTALALALGALPITLLPSYAVFALGLAWRQRLLSAAGAALVLAHLLVIAPALGAQDLPVGAREAPRLRVVTANLYVLNPTFTEAGRALRELRPDVLVVPELSAEGLAGLREAGLLAELPHSVVLLEDSREAVGLFSRFPLRDTTTRFAGARELPRATVEVDGVPVRLLAVHTFPPLSVYQSLWRASLRDLAQEVAGTELPAVVIGDLNADRDHAAFRRLLDAGLRDAHDERGRGLARTWPAGFPLLHLDHVLVRDGAAARLAVLEIREAEVPGSDHLAVVADLAVLPS